VAIKILRRSDNAQQKQRSHTEALIHRHLTHPNIIQWLDAWETDQSVTVMVMEWAAGGELFDKIRKFHLYTMK
jgi:serine/threonine protein kinase